jgi:RNA polymerase-binding transcription factor DksA
MIRAADLSLIKQAMLKRLDATFRQNYHQSLSEVLNELRMRSVLSQPDPTPDKVFSVILEAHVLSYKPISSVNRMREALERLARGKYGLCVRCGRELPTELLLNDPTESSCQLCQRSPDA